MLGLLMAALIVLPIVGTIVRTFAESEGLSAFTRAAELDDLGTTLLNTAIVVVVAVSAATLIGTVLAWLSERTTARMGWVSEITPVMPLLVPPVALAVGFVFLFSPRAGVVNVAIRSFTRSEATTGPFNIFSWYGLLSLYVIELIPVVYLVVSAALRSVDPALEQASRTAGAGLFRTFVSVTLPSIRPAVVSSMFMSLTIALTLFSAPAIVGATAGIDVLSVRIVRLLTATYPPETDVAVVLGLLTLICIGAAWTVQLRILAAQRFAVVGGKGQRASLIDLGPWTVPAKGLVLTFLSFATVLPALGLILVSVQRFWSPRIEIATLGFDAYRRVFASGSITREAITNSVALGAAGATIALMIATLCALALRERATGVFRAIDGLLKLPAGMSNIVIAVGILVTFAGSPFNLSGTVAILLLAYVIIYMPQASIAANSAGSLVGRQLTEASSIAGAAPSRTMRRVLLPLMVPSLASGWTLLFVYMAGDLTASVLLASTNTPTVGYVLYEQFTSGSYPTIAALAVVLTSVSSLVAFSVLVLSRRARTT
ncbi:ABC transporter permease [Aeromicrobium phragmitis]|uniref:ABC transporter permease n=1 Tax=Aeromicrobium phragmitis TaxID=2478914 RepID=UPI00140CFEA0|nr:iron ABC transporter permease [Aeromicrobium phragmitis]